MASIFIPLLEGIFAALSTVSSSKKVTDKSVFSNNLVERIFFERRQTSFFGMVMCEELPGKASEIQ